MKKYCVIFLILLSNILLICCSSQNNNGYNTGVNPSGQLTEYSTDITENFSENDTITSTPVAEPEIVTLADFELTEPVYTVIPGSQEWVDLENVNKRIEACRIGQELLDRLTDRQLVRAVADFPFLIDIFLTSYIERTVIQLNNQSDAYRELMTRKGAKKAIFEFLQLTESSFEEDNTNATFLQESFAAILAFEPTFADFLTDTEWILIEDYSMNKAWSKENVMQEKERTKADGIDPYYVEKPVDYNDGYANAVWEEGGIRQLEKGYQVVPAKGEKVYQLDISQTTYENDNEHGTLYLVKVNEFHGATFSFEYKYEFEFKHPSSIQSPDASLTFEDVNHDGYFDIQTVAAIDSDSQVYQYYWLWNNDTKMWEERKDFEALPN